MFHLECFIKNALPNVNSSCFSKKNCERNELLRK